MMPEISAYLNLTFVFGIKIYSPVNISQVSTKGVNRIRVFTIGASRTKSSICFDMVVMNKESPPEQYGLKPKTNKNSLANFSC